MKNIKKANVKDTYFKIFPLALILFIVPLIVFMKPVTIEGTAAQVYPSSTVYDFFNYYKVLWLIVFTVSSILFATCYAYVKKLKLTLSFYFIPLLVYYLFVFISASFSKYHDISFNGSIDRFEGLWVISCYVILCFISAHFITYQRDIEILFFALGLCTTLLCILGITQFFGFDLLQTNFMKHVMLPSEYNRLSESLNFKFPTKYVYLTLFNPNYVGSFCAMILPICIVILFLTKKKLIRIFSGALSTLVLVNLICSRSSTGYISVFVSIFFIIVLLRKKIIKYWIPVSSLAICCIGLLAYLNLNNSGFITNEFRNFLPQKQNQVVTNDGKYITDMLLNKNMITIYMDDIYLNIIFDSKNKVLSFLDESQNEVKFRRRTTDKNLILFDQTKYKSLRIHIDGTTFTISASNTKYYVALDETSSFKFINGIRKPVNIIKAESFGFEGYEKWASNRGYIWSRSIPLLKDTILLGHGPDTYVFYFPQNDFKGKLLSFNNPYMLVDKPHNMYLQMAINTGIVSLIAFLAFVLWYICSSLKLYFRPKNDNSFYYMAGSACVISVIGFLIAGIANDSNVNVSPIFWILLGIGFACNRLYSRELNFPTSTPKFNVAPCKKFK